MTTTTAAVEALLPLLLNIPLSQIEDNPILLRKVDKNSVKYQEMKDSIAKDGVINAISVYPSTTSDGRTPKLNAKGEPLYRQIDGGHRLACCRDLMKESVPCQVRTTDDANVKRLQLVANAHIIETKPVEFSVRMRELIQDHPTVTVQEIAADVCKSVDWVVETMELDKLEGNSQKSGEPHTGLAALVDQGQIPVATAYALSKLDPEEQVKFTELATGERAEIAVAQIKAHAKKLRDAKRAGKKPGDVPQFHEFAHYRKKEETQAEYESPNVLPALLAAAGISDEESKVTKFVLRWVLSLDPQSVAAMKEKFDAKIAKQQETKLAKKKERDERDAKFKL